MMLIRGDIAVGSLPSPSSILPLIRLIYPKFFLNDKYFFVFSKIHVAALSLTVHGFIYFFSKYVIISIMDTVTYNDHERKYHYAHIAKTATKS